MEKEQILRRLHHRPPYLLIDAVHSHGPHDLHATASPNEQDFYLQGHFPGTPVVPGAMLQEMTTQAAGLLISEHYSPLPDYDSSRATGWALGVLRAVHFAKYKRFARPGQPLDIRITLLEHSGGVFRFKGQIHSHGEKLMANEFTLVNISGDKLSGHA